MLRNKAFERIVSTAGFTRDLEGRTSDLYSRSGIAVVVTPDCMRVFLPDSTTMLFRLERYKSEYDLERKFRELLSKHEEKLDDSNA